MNRFMKLALMFAFAAAATAPAHTIAEKAPVESKLAIGSAAPDFTLSDHAGKQFKLSDQRGKIVVLHWTNSQCPFIKRHYEAKTFNAIAEEYAAKNVIVAGIDSSNFISPAALASTAKENQLSYPLLVDKDGAVGRQYGAKTTPHVFIIGADGNVAYQGAVDDDPAGDAGQSTNYVMGALDSILTGKPVTMAVTKPYGCSVKYSA